MRPALLLLPFLAASIVVPALLLSSANTSAVQAPKILLDMDPTGNTYSDPGAGGDNSMTVGTIDNCLTTIPGNNAAHNHTVHLIIQDVEDLVGWQARLNYDGTRMRPLSVNFLPFTDTNTGDTLSFVNLPLDAGSHRALTNASNIDPAPGTTALIGGAYLGTQTSPISPDTPAKTVPDDTSYSAPSGGVLAILTLRVEAGQDGQSSLTMDLDDDVPNAPGSRAVVFTGSGTTDINLGEGDLFDGRHGEGVACVPPVQATSTPTATAPSGTGTPTPTTGPGTATATAVVAAGTATPTALPSTGGAAGGGGSGWPIWIYLLVAGLPISASAAVVAWWLQSQARRRGIT